MAHADEKSPAELADRVWELAGRIKVCLFTSWDGSRQRMRPLTANPDREAHQIQFLVSAENEANWQVERFPEVTLGFADNAGNKYVTITGQAELGSDRATIRKLWSPFAKAWWESADDPDIRVLTVTPDAAELWDSPGRLVAAAVMLTAAVTGGTPEVGDHGRVRL